MDKLYEPPQESGEAAQSQEEKSVEVVTPMKSGDSWILSEEDVDFLCGVGVMEEVSSDDDMDMTDEDSSEEELLLDITFTGNTYLRFGFGIGGGYLGAVVADERSVNWRLHEYRGCTVPINSDTPLDAEVWNHIPIELIDAPYGNSVVHIPVLVNDEDIFAWSNCYVRDRPNHFYFSTFMDSYYDPEASKEEIAQDIAGMLHIIASSELEDRYMLVFMKMFAIYTAGSDIHHYFRRTSTKSARPYGLPAGVRLGKCTKCDRYTWSSAMKKCVADDCGEHYKERPCSFCSWGMLPDVDVNGHTNYVCYNYDCDQRYHFCDKHKGKLMFFGETTWTCKFCFLEGEEKEKVERKKEKPLPDHYMDAFNEPADWKPDPPKLPDLPPLPECNIDLDARRRDFELRNASDHVRTFKLGPIYNVNFRNEGEAIDLEGMPELEPSTVVPGRVEYKYNANGHLIGRNEIKDKRDFLPKVPDPDEPKKKLRSKPILKKVKPKDKFIDMYFDPVPVKYTKYSIDKTPARLWLTALVFLLMAPTVFTVSYFSSIAATVLYPAVVFAAKYFKVGSNKLWYMRLVIPFAFKFLFYIMSFSDVGPLLGVTLCFTSLIWCIQSIMIRKQTYTKNLFSIARYVRDGPVDEKKDSRVDAVSIGDTKHTSKLQYWEIITPTLKKSTGWGKEIAVFCGLFMIPFSSRSTWRTGNHVISERYVRHDNTEMMAWLRERAGVMVDSSGVTVTDKIEFKNSGEILISMELLQQLTSIDKINHCSKPEVVFEIILRAASRNTTINLDKKLTMTTGQSVSSNTVQLALIWARQLQQHSAFSGVNSGAG